MRLLGDGELKAKVTFEVYGASKSAIAAVEKAGGKVTFLAPAVEAPAAERGRRSAHMRRRGTGEARAAG